MTQSIYNASLSLVNSMTSDPRLINAKCCSNISQVTSTAPMEEMRRTMTKAAEDQTEFLEPLSMLYKQMVDQNDTDIIDISAGCVKHFDCVLVRFEAASYMKRIALHAKASPCCLITSLIYLERAQHNCPSLRLTSRTLQRLLLVAVMTATKYLEDSCCLNSHWAEIGVLTLKELNALEREFLSCLQYRLGVHPEEYTRCTARLASFAVSPWQDGWRTLLCIPDGGTLLPRITCRGSREAKAAGTVGAQPWPPTLPPDGPTAAKTP